MTINDPSSIFNRCELVFWFLDINFFEKLHVIRKEEILKHRSLAILPPYTIFYVFKSSSF